MDRDFTLGTELTEEDIGGDRHVSVRRALPPNSPAPNLKDTYGTGAGFVVGVLLAFWLVFSLLLGANQPQRPNDTTKPALSEVPAALPPGTPKPSVVTVELGANGIVIRGAPTTDSKPSFGVGKTTHKAAPAASPPARSRAASAAAASQPDQ
jgi:hypothetical protein